MQRRPINHTPKELLLDMLHFREWLRPLVDVEESLFVGRVGTVSDGFTLGAAEMDRLFVVVHLVLHIVVIVAYQGQFMVVFVFV